MNPPKAAHFSNFNDIVILSITMLIEFYLETKFSGDY